MSQSIKTIIKFYKGLGGVESRIYGLVTKKNGSWRGCRETDECKRKIVFVDPSISKDIIPNALYSCSLVPMKNKDGFIAKSAQLVKFKAMIDTKITKKVCRVVVKFGNKEIVYDPSSKEKRQRDIKQIADKLRNRIDLIDANQVAEDFLNSACIVKRIFEQGKCS